MASWTNQRSDDETRTGVIYAFQRMVDELEQAERTVINSSSELGARWLGEASMRYQQGLQEISQGIVQIRSGLGDISGSMQRFAAITDSTEDDNIAAAASVSLQTETFTPQASWTN
ncbi:WXG100 family type VII secretion target [Micromonospora musae]|uniref:WXG100 family type VII secretion target n=1 Tax=Micromonospora musae TaxID=1894970 RepID=UPI0033CB30C9